MTFVWSCRPLVGALAKVTLAPAIPYNKELAKQQAVIQQVSVNNAAGLACPSWLADRKQDQLSADIGDVTHCCRTCKQL